MVIDECQRQQEHQQPNKPGAGGGVILDVCCGTGTIGICAAVRLRCSAQDQDGPPPPGGGIMPVVLGVELCPGAVGDARVNAARNGVANAAFVCAKGGWEAGGGVWWGVGGLRLLAAADFYARARTNGSGGRAGRGVAGR